jgi:peptidoglycan/xylan/chitin deacetylase (PgdA/CDA1 family)
VSDVLVLCYHGVSASWPADTTVTPDRFAAQVAHLARRGYRALTLGEALTAPGPGRTVAITFDDALVSVRDVARPILERHGMVATVFVPTDHAGEGRGADWDGIAQWAPTHARELEVLDWDALRALDAAGWEIGSHTRSHPRLTGLEDRALADELEGSLAACEDALQRRCDSLAYPYSDVDDRVVRAAGAAGYRFAVTVPDDLQPPLPLQWPRVIVDLETDARGFALRAARPVRALRLSPVWPALKRARRAVRALRR